MAVMIFGVLIFIHEFGHYICARLFGVSIYEFAIGMGPKILKWTSKKTGIKYTIRALPIGGFVSMVGEDEEADVPGSLNRKPVWQRLIITSAGSVMNLLLGILLMFIMVLTSVSLGGTTVARLRDDGNSPAELSGLKTGDTILKIGDTRVHTAVELVYEVMRNGIEPLDVTVEREGKKVILPEVEFDTATEGGIVFGSIDFLVNAEPKTFGTVLKHTFYQSLSSIKMIWQSLFDLISGRYGIEQVSGPVGVTQAIGEAATVGTSSLLYLCTLIAMNLAVFNLLPLPALDGGRIAFLLVELIRGKPIKREYEGYVHFAGIVILLLFMIFVTYKDLLKLISN
ncbi:MAG: site-2 protease family protein [Eubacteriales bacterium]|nr:site-2 protease family protein [Eubacteriales bacterium]